jgi:LysM repeat protein
LCRSRSDSIIAPPKFKAQNARIILSLELRQPGFYVRFMKRISLCVVAALLVLPAVMQAQDAAVKERLDQLAGKIQDLQDARDAQNKRIEELARHLRELQEQQARPNASYASQEDLRQLAAKLHEIDRKRQDDYELIVKQLKGLGNAIGAPAKKTAPAAPTEPPEAASVPSKGYEYVVQSGDNLSAIVKAYRDKNINVTVEQILKANPGLKPESMRIGQKIFIPAPSP